MSKNKIAKGLRTLEKMGFDVKRVERSELGDSWPFVTDTVLIGAKEKVYFVVWIDGKLYCLNGLAASKYGLESPHFAGKALIGKSTYPILEIARRFADEQL